MFPLKLALQVFFQDFLLLSAKWIYLQNYSKKFWYSFAISLARLLIYNPAKSDWKSKATFLAINFISIFTFRQWRVETLVNRLLCYESRFQTLWPRRTFWNASIGKRMIVTCWECEIQVSVGILGALIKYHFLNATSGFTTFHFLSFLRLSWASTKYQFL